jgi:ABC-type lipoprotein export system ATPase subunit
LACGALKALSDAKTSRAGRRTGAVRLAGEVLRTRRLRKTFESEGIPVRALRRVDLTVEAGEFVAIMGPSGCGKSTLLNLVAGLDSPSDGEIVLAGIPLTDRDESERARIRRAHIGVVFQFFNLLEEMSVRDNVALSAAIAGSSRRQAERRARELLDLLGLGDKGSEMPGVLSGGQRQRLAIARGARERADAPSWRRADRRARLRGGARGPRAVPPPARRRPDDPPRYARSARGGGGPAGCRDEGWAPPGRG